jgi:hypothetical protein
MMVGFAARTSRSVLSKCTDKNVCATHLSWHSVLPCQGPGGTDIPVCALLCVARI